MVINLSIFSCSYNPKKLTPHFIDPDKMTTREYKVVETKPEIKFEFVKENPLKKAVVDNGGLLCLPVPQALEIKRKWENHKKKNRSNDILDLERVSTDFVYKNDSFQDLDILSGVDVEEEMQNGSATTED